MPKRPTGKADDQLVIISCRAPRRVRKRLEALARAARRSQSSYLRLIIEDAVREPGRAVTGPPE